MLLYQRYFIKNIFPLFITITFSITSLVWITQILKLLYLLDKGIKITHFFNLVILVLPSLLFILLPIITVITIIYTYNNLKIERQLIILQVSGINNLQIAKPAFYVSVIITVFAYYLSFTAIPISYINLKSRLSFIKNNYISNMIEEKTFNKISKDITIYIDKKLVNNSMSGIIIFDNRTKNNPAILFAEFGIFTAYKDNPIFELNKGIRQIYDKNNNITQLMFSSLTVKLNNDNLLTYARDNKDKDSNEYYINELLNPSHDISYFKKKKLIAEGHQRIIWPIYNFVLPFCALAIYLRYPYTREKSLTPILLAVTYVFVVTSIHFICQNIASKDLNFIFASYLNIVITTILGLYLFLRTTL